MDNNNHIRLENRDHISKEMMIRYVNDQLSAREKHQVEKHTVDCDLCADALEGVMAMKDRGALKGILEKIDRRVLGSEEKKTGPTILWMDTRVRVAAAAGAALLIGCIWFFNRNLNGVEGDKTVSQTIPGNNNTVTNNPVVDSSKLGPKKPDETPVTSTTTGKEDKNAQNKITATDEKKTGGKFDEDGDHLKDQHDGPPKFSLTETNRKDSKPTDDRSKNDPNGGDVNKSGEVTNTQKPQPENTKVVTGNTSNDVKQQTITNTYNEKEVVLSEVQVQQDKVNKMDEQEIVTTKTSKDKDKKGKEENDQQSQSKTNSGGSFGFTQPNTQAPVQNKDMENSNTVSNNDSPKKEPLKDNNDGYYKSPADTSKYLVNMTDSLSKTEQKSDGVMRYEGKDYSGAETKFRATLKTDPKNRESLYYLGATYLEQGKADLAIEQFDKLIALGKGAYYDEARYKKSEALMKQGKKTEAKVILDQLIKENSPMKQKSVDLEKK